MKISLLTYARQQVSACGTAAHIARLTGEYESAERLERGAACWRTGARERRALRAVPPANPEGMFVVSASKAALIDAAIIRAEEAVRSVATFIQHQTIAGYSSAVVSEYVPWRYAEEDA